MKRFIIKKLSLRTILIIIAVVAVVSGAIVWATSRDDSDTQTQQGFYSDTASRFTFTYPESWTVFDAPEVGSAAKSVNWTEVSKPISLSPTGDKNGNMIQIKPGCQTTGADGQEISVLQSLEDQKDQYHTQQYIAIGNYDGFYDLVKFDSPTESYVKHIYFMSNGASCLTFTYTQQYVNNVDGTGFDDSVNEPVLKDIVKSVEFF